MLTRSRLVALGLGFLMLGVPGAAAAQSSGTNAQNPTSDHRAVWTAIGAGIGFGGGLLIGLQAFDDAVYAERKIWTTALVGAAAGGVAGNLLSRPRRSRTGDPVTPDPSWEGMAIGAASGAVVGLWYIPKVNCKTDINPECPGRLRIAAGIPLIAGGAALGAWIDRLFTDGSPSPARGPIPRTTLMPMVGPGGVGVVFRRVF